MIVKGTLTKKTEEYFDINPLDVIHKLFYPIPDLGTSSSYGIGRHYKYPNKIVIYDDYDDSLVRELTEEETECYEAIELLKQYYKKYHLK